MDGGHVSARPGVRSGASTDHTPRVTLQAHGSKAQRLPDLGAYQGLPLFLLREEVTLQRCGVPAGAEVHRRLGGVGGLQREREVLCPGSGDAVALGHISLVSGVSGR